MKQTELNNLIADGFAGMEAGAGLYLNFNAFYSLHLMKGNYGSGDYVELVSRRTGRSLFIGKSTKGHSANFLPRFSAARLILAFVAKQTAEAEDSLNRAVERIEKLREALANGLDCEVLSHIKDGSGYLGAAYLKQQALPVVPEIAAAEQAS